MKIWTYFIMLLVILSLVGCTSNSVDDEGIIEELEDKKQELKEEVDKNIAESLNCAMLSFDVQSVCESDGIITAVISNEKTEELMFDVEITGDSDSNVVNLDESLGSYAFKEYVVDVSSMNLGKISLAKFVPSVGINGEFSLCITKAITKSIDVC